MRSPKLAVALGGVAYIVAVTQRSTLGVASLVAAARFHTNAEQLSMLAVAQLIVYAAMQIPAGLLLDRFGPRKTLFFGTLSIAAGQYVVAFSTVLAPAIVGRMFVGLGDAFIFLSMIRLINSWYSGPRASSLQQWLGNGGQLGQIVSAFPFAMLLTATNWQFAFFTWASISLLVAFGVYVLVMDDPTHQSSQHQVHWKSRIAHLRNDIRRPSTKAAFWIHLSCNSPGTVMLLLWGVPFLQQGEGLPREVALGIISSFVAIGLFFGILYGWICGKHPQLRKLTLSLSVSVLATGWLTILLWPGRAPLWMLIIWAVTTAVNNPASMIAFDYTRQYAPKRQLGSINGFANTGGFIAGLSMMFVIGLILDVYYATIGKAAGLALYSLQGFKLALLIVVAMAIFGHLRYRSNEKKIALTTEASE